MSQPLHGCEIQDFLPEEFEKAVEEANEEQEYWTDELFESFSESSFLSSSARAGGY